MGENVLESQAKNTKKRRARRAADEQQGRLFERADRVSDEFTVDRTTSTATPKVGDVLHCYIGKGKAPVDVAFENQQIGVVNEGGGDVLREITQPVGCQAAVIQSICELTDTMKIQIKTD